MKLRKSLALLLTLALTLGVAPIAGADGAVKGQSTTYESVGTVTQSPANTSESPGNARSDLTIETINVTITNIYNIQVNPYGMTIETPDKTGASDESIVTAPMYIENSSGVKMEVTATATATPFGDVVLDDESTRYAYQPGPFDDPSLIPKEERVFLYMKMTGQDKDGKPLTTEPAVITKEDGSDPLTVYIPANTTPTPTSATLQIFGDTSLPTYYGSWHRGNGFEVLVVRSFMPIQDEPGYTVGFDVQDYWWDQGYGLAFPVEIQIEGNSEPLAQNPLLFEKGYTSSDSIPADKTVKAEKSLTFTVKTGDEPKGYCYTIRKITLIRSGKDDEVLYEWEKNDPDLVQCTKIINAANVDPNEELSVLVVLDEATIQ